MIVVSVLVPLGTEEDVEMLKSSQERPQDPNLGKTGAERRDGVAIHPCPHVIYVGSLFFVQYGLQGQELDNGM